MEQIPEKTTTYIKIDAKSAIMQKVEQNLAEAKRVENMNVDKAKEAFELALASEVCALNSKLSSLKRQKLEHPTFNPDTDSVLQTFFSQKDRLILKCSYNKSHQNRMRKQYPAIPLHVLSDTEKACFQFANSLDFDSGVYAIDGHASLQKSQFMDNSNAQFNQYGMSGGGAGSDSQFIGPECQVMQAKRSQKAGSSDPNAQLKDMLKNTLFGEFLNAPSDHDES